MVEVVFEVARARRSEVRTVRVARGTLLRVALREIGQSAEGCAVLEGDVPVPLDLPLDSSAKFTVVPTFSGG